MLPSAACKGAASFQCPGWTLTGSGSRTCRFSATTRRRVRNGHSQNTPEAGSASVVGGGSSGSRIRLYRRAIVATHPVPDAAFMALVAVLYPHLPTRPRRVTAAVPPLEDAAAAGSRPPPNPL